jgi:hypothetical protein
MLQYETRELRRLQLMATTEIEANPSAVYKTVILLGAFFPLLLRFFYCRAFIKERRVNPPLLQGFPTVRRAYRIPPCRFTTHFKRPSSKGKKKVFFFPQY